VNTIHQAAKLVAALLRVARVTAGVTESNESYTAGFITHVTCRLTAKDQDQLLFYFPALQMFCEFEQTKSRAVPSSLPQNF